MSENPTSLTAMLQKQLGGHGAPEEDSTVNVLGDETALAPHAATECEVDILKERIRSLSAQVKEGFRKEVDLQEQVRAAQAELRQVQQANYESDDAHSRRLFSVYKELFSSLERKPTTSPLDDKVELEKLAAEWLKEVTECKGYLETSFKNEGTLRDSQIAEIKKYPDAIAKLTQSESCHWHQAEVFRLYYWATLHDSLKTAATAIKAIQMAQTSLRTDASPSLTGLAFEAAKSAKEAFDSLYTGLRDDIIYGLEKAVVCAEDYVRHRKPAGSLKA